MTDPTRLPATGYPAQPTNNYYYPNYNNQQNYQPYPHAPPYQPPLHPRAAFYRRVISAIIFTFIIFSVLLFIVWLVLRPRVPIITVTSLSLSSLNLTTSTAATAATTFSAVTTTRLSVANPNRNLHLYYDQITARLYYKSAFLTQNELPPFDQGGGDLTVVNATLVASSAYVSGDILKDFNGDRSKGEVEFDLQVIAVVSFNRGGWRARRRILRVSCDDLEVNFRVNASNGNFSGGQKRCAVGLA